MTGSCEHGNDPWVIMGKEFPNTLSDHQPHKDDFASYCWLNDIIIKEIL